MPKYRIEWTEEDWYRMDVDAESGKDALDKFYAGEYSHLTATKVESGFLQDGVDITEVG